MFLVIISLLSIIVALCRKGSFANIADSGIRAWYLFAVAILAFLAVRMGDVMDISLITNYAKYILLASYALLLLGAIFNIGNLWMIPLLFGSILNFVVMFINGGKMPLTLSAINIAGISPTAIEASSMYSVAGSTTSLMYLGGIIPIPLPSILAQVVSPGTVIIAVGLFFIIQNVMLGIVYEYDDEEDYEDYDDYSTVPQEGVADVFSDDDLPDINAKDYTLDDGVVRRELSSQDLGDDLRNAFTDDEEEEYGEEHEEASEEYEELPEEKTDSSDAAVLTAAAVAAGIAAEEILTREPDEEEDRTVDIFAEEEGEEEVEFGDDDEIFFDDDDELFIDNEGFEDLEEDLSFADLEDEQEPARDPEEPEVLSAVEEDEPERSLEPEDVFVPEDVFDEEPEELIPDAFGEMAFELPGEDIAEDISEDLPEFEPETAEEPAEEVSGTDGEKEPISVSDDDFAMFVNGTEEETEPADEGPVAEEAAEKFDPDDLSLDGFDFGDDFFAGDFNFEDVFEEAAEDTGAAGTAAAAVLAAEAVNDADVLAEEAEAAAQDDLGFDFDFDEDFTFEDLEFNDPLTEGASEEPETEETEEIPAEDAVSEEEITEESVSDEEPETGMEETPDPEDELPEDDWDAFSFEDIEAELTQEPEAEELPAEEAVEEISFEDIPGELSEDSAEEEETAEAEVPEAILPEDTDDTAEEALTEEEPETEETEEIPAEDAVPEEEPETEELPEETGLAGTEEEPEETEEELPEDFELIPEEEPAHEQTPEERKAELERILAEEEKSFEDILASYYKELGGSESEPEDTEESVYAKTIDTSSVDIPDIPTGSDIFNRIAMNRQRQAMEAMAQKEAEETAAAAAEEAYEEIAEEVIDTVDEELPEIDLLTEEEPETRTFADLIGRADYTDEEFMEELFGDLDDDAEIETEPEEEEPEEEEPEPEPVDVDSPFVIVDGKIVENPNYKFRKRGTGGLSRMREAYREDPKPAVYEAPVKEAVKEKTVNPVESVLSQPEEKPAKLSSEGFEKIEMKLGDVQIKFWKKDNE